MEWLKNVFGRRNHEEGRNALQLPLNFDELPGQQEPNEAVEELRAQQEQQAAITIQHAFNEFLARRRATRVRVPLESQVAERRTRRHVRQIKQDWCGGIGSKEEMQAKAQKKEEGAAKREKERAYSSTHQKQPVGE